MSTTVTIDTLITSAQADQAALDALILQLKSETLRSDDVTLFPAPLFDDATQTWTLFQNTPDANGVYEGQYTLVAADGCAIVEIVSIDAHTNPVSGAPAVLVECGASNYTDQVSVNALHGKSLKKLKIRSGSPFQVKVKLLAQWCYEWDFTAGAGGWSAQRGSLGASGWENTTYTPAHNCYDADIRYSLVVTGTIEKIEAYIINPSSRDRLIGATLADNSVVYSYQTNPATGWYSFAFSPPVSGAIELFVENDGDSSGQTKITKSKVSGTGANPVGTYNCT